MVDSSYTSPRAEALPRGAPAVFAGLILVLVLASLDQNILNTALPRIAGDLGGLSRLSWVITAFLVTSVLSTPLYGKLSDIYGRRSVIVTSVSIFLVGSALCGFAQSLEQLILFRAVQGLGAGGLITLAQTA
jgi:MFS family permease